MMNETTPTHQVMIECKESCINPRPVRVVSLHESPDEAMKMADKFRDQNHSAWATLYTDHEHVNEFAPDPLKEMFVLVPTNPRINHVGAIIGPFFSIADADEAKTKLDYPTPDEVFIRRVQAPHNCSGEFDAPIERTGVCYLCGRTLQQHEWFECMVGKFPKTNFG